MNAQLVMPHPKFIACHPLCLNMLPCFLCPTTAIFGCLLRHLGRHLRTSLQHVAANATADNAESAVNRIMNSNKAPVRCPCIA